MHENKGNITTLIIQYNNQQTQHC